MLGGPQIRSEHDNEKKNPCWEASAHVAVHSQSHMTCCGIVGDVNEFNDFLSLFCFAWFINGVLVSHFAY